MPTKIEWTNETWNPISGCSKISTGCRNCYAERMAKRLAGRFGYPEQPHHFDVTFHESQFNKLYRWNKPRMVFVCSMGDLFHKDVPENILMRILNHFRVYDKHTYQVLTKRPKRMYEVYSKFIEEHCDSEILENVWLGVTTENQEAADERIPWLLKTPAAIHFVSVEPMLGPVTFRWAKWMPVKDHNHLDGLRKLDWIICGGETGPGARELKWEWLDNLYSQCKEANIPFFFKRVGDKFNGKDLLKAESLAWNRQWPRK